MPSATSAGAQLCPSLAPPRRRRRCCRVKAASAPLPSVGLGLGRRAVSLAGVAAWFATTTGRAEASPFDNYVKKKKLEPLETYVPAVLLTQDQFRDLEKSLEFEKPRFDERCLAPNSEAFISSKALGAGRHGELSSLADKERSWESSFIQKQWALQQLRRGDQ